MISHRHSTPIRLSLMMSLALGITSHLQAQTVADGNFELGGSNGAGPVGGNLSSSWTQHDDHDVDVYSSPTTGDSFAIGVTASPAGGNFAAAASTTSGSHVEGIYQTVSGFEIGSSYTLLFYQTHLGADPVAGNNDDGRWAVSMFGDTQYSAAMSYQGAGNQTWSVQEMTFVATSTSTTLQLLANSLGTTSHTITYLGIDGITLTQSIPEPSGALLLGAAMVSLSLRRRREV